MRFTQSAIVFLSLISAALGQTDDFVPIKKPEENETVKSGSTFTIEWDAGAYYPGLMNLVLMKGDDIDDLEEVGAIRSEFLAPNPL